MNKLIFIGILALSLSHAYGNEEDPQHHIDAGLVYSTRSESFGKALSFSVNGTEMAIHDEEERPLWTKGAPLPLNLEFTGGQLKPGKYIGSLDLSHGSKNHSGLNFSVVRLDLREGSYHTHLPTIGYNVADSNEHQFLKFEIPTVIINDDLRNGLSNVSFLGLHGKGGTSFRTPDGTRFDLEGGIQLEPVINTRDNASARVRCPNLTEKECLHVQQALKDFSTFQQVGIGTQFVARGSLTGYPQFTILGQQPYVKASAELSHENVTGRMNRGGQWQGVSISEGDGVLLLSVGTRLGGKSAE